MVLIVFTKYQQTLTMKTNRFVVRIVAHLSAINFYQNESAPRRLLIRSVRQRFGEYVASPYDLIKDMLLYVWSPTSFDDSTI